MYKLGARILPFYEKNTYFQTFLNLKNISKRILYREVPYNISSFFSTQVFVPEKMSRLREEKNFLKLGRICILKNRGFMMISII
jgi:hypothetical protein